MPEARSNIIDEESVGIYHCYSRCVRRAFLCGIDKVTGRNYNHRREWTVERLKFLSKVFLVDVLAYSIMSTHHHVMVRNRPDRAMGADDRDIAYRWLLLFHKAEQWNYKLNCPRDSAIDELCQDVERIELFRKRLSSISWFMRCLKEKIAVMANKEDDVKGHFWESRFNCKKIEDDLGLITCMVYVDLNEVSANMCNSSKESLFSSAYKRIVAQEKRECGITNEEALDDEWLVPLEDNAKDDMYIPITQKAYTVLLDETVKCVVHKKEVSNKLRLLLKDLKIHPEQWLNTMANLPKQFSLIVGSQNSLKKASNKLNKKWLKGMKIAQVLFV